MNECKKSKGAKEEEKVLELIKKKERLESKPDEKNDVIPANTVASDDKDLKKNFIKENTPSEEKNYQNQNPKREIEQKATYLNSANEKTSIKKTEVVEATVLNNPKPVSKLLNILDEDHTLNEQELDEYIN